MEIESTAQIDVDFVKISDFIAKDNSSAAKQFVKRLRERIEVLRTFPEAGPRIRKRSNVHGLVERSIIIVYAVGIDRIEILRFWHGARGNLKIGG